MKVSFLGFGTISQEIVNTIRSLEVGTDIIFESFYDPYHDGIIDLDLKKLESFSDLITSNSQIIIEAASQDAVKNHIPTLLKAKKDIITLSVGAYLDLNLYKKILLICENPKNGNLYIPSGALPSVDSIKAASLSNLDKVELTTRKPPAALIDAPGFERYSYSELNSEEIIFSGNAVEAVKLFPKNINIAATLSLSGIGPERTKVIIIADPTITRNIHTVEVIGSFGSLKTEIINEPSNNLKTSKMAALSASSLLLRITEGIKIGS